jgi:hypothetical protein
MKLRTIAIFAAGVFCGREADRLWFSSSPVTVSPQSACSQSESRVAALPAPRRREISAPGRRPGSGANAIREDYAFSPARELVEGQDAKPDAEDCPPNASDFHATHPAEDRLSCRCSIQAVEVGSVWGTSIYTSDSSICRAAKHAGLWRADGDEVTLFFKPGQEKYEGSENFGVRSEGYGPWESSFSF